MDTKDIQKSAMHKSPKFTFTSPPEAPVFEPTPEEFLDPLGYIAKIRPVAEKTGICKIKPPARWQPPFSLDVDKFKFVPRIQKINELEAITRLKLIFLQKLHKFWNLQGTPVNIPMIENKTLDLYCLKFWVNEEGGFEKCNTSKIWLKIAEKMGYSQNFEVINLLINSYKKFLLPFVVIEKSEPVIKDNNLEKNKVKYEHFDQMPRNKCTKPIKNPNQKYQYVEKIQKNETGSEIKVEPNSITHTKIADGKRIRELKKLEFHGPGPKMTGLKDKDFYLNSNSNRPPRNTLKRKKDPSVDYMCFVCHQYSRSGAMLNCNDCDDMYHAFCLKPPLTGIPVGDWNCPCCIAEEVHKPAEAFGFDQAEREYTLQQFGEMADNFKSQYFGKSGHLVPTEVVEKEFWKIISSVDEDVTVEYGADLHSMDHGSGFPTKSSLNLYPGDKEYVDSGWNLNNIPVQEGSVLRYINSNISGMTVPWMYVGMCFSSFCWHIEDHWIYSINYLHWGEAKTWYGVPGGAAQLFENTMKAAAPDLFKTQPDLLHQLVTIMNPNILMAAGVPIYRTDQQAGEFVITFPRAYHAGFNQGYNFAESVNFAPPDWLKIGAECILHYKKLKRFCVFSHDELICKIALEGDRLDLETALEAHKELMRAAEEEDILRSILLKNGLQSSWRTTFELMSDEKRLCEICNSTCFLSSLFCSQCEQMSCLQHADDLCQCPLEEKIIFYRYDTGELQLMLQMIELRVNSFEKWKRETEYMLLPTAPIIGRIQNFKALIDEANELRITRCALLTKLKDEYTKGTEYIVPIVIELNDD